MASPPLTAQEETEVGLIQSDANDLARLFLGMKGRPDAGVLPYTTVGLVGLVAEESYRYLSSKSPKSALRTQEPDLFSKFSTAVTKVRARLKLFDDTDGYSEGLIAALDVAHFKSVQSFNQPHSGLLRSLIRYLQPDLGIFFVNDDLIATSHTALPAFGITLEELEALPPIELQGLGKRLYDFSYAVGKYLAQLSLHFSAFGRPLQLQPEPLPSINLKITHNDFIGAKAYRVATDALQPTTGTVGPAIMALAQINSAIHVLPHLLEPSSNLLLRFQFLTVFHSGNLLNSVVPQLTSSLPQFTPAQREALHSKKMRNLCAHYGLRDLGERATASADPYGYAIHETVGLDRSELQTLLSTWLRAMSATLGGRLSKTSLARARALFGSHS